MIVNPGDSDTMKKVRTTRYRNYGYQCPGEFCDWAQVPKSFHPGKK
jgi:hypothetical protein